MSAFAPYVGLAREGLPLSRAEMRAAMDILFDGDAPEDEIVDFLLTLKRRGETVDEIAGAAEALRSRMDKVAAPEGAIDTCGTGGDGAGTLNISTAAAFIVAGAGVPVAKHGNRAASSKSGSADVLAALGVDIEAPKTLMEQALREARIGFLFAPRHHPAVARVAAARRRIGVRTLFNAIGPLANPSGARRQLLGVYDRTLTTPLAHALAALGSHRAFVVHGADGLDEISINAETYVASLEDGVVREFTLSPEKAGLKRAPLAAITGGDPIENAGALRRLLGGERGAYRDIAVLNAAAALLVAGAAADLREAAERAAAAIDTGAAGRALDALVAITTPNRA